MPYLPGITGFLLHSDTAQPQVVPTLANTSGSLPVFWNTKRHSAGLFCFTEPKLYSVLINFILAPLLLPCAKDVPANKRQDNRLIISVFFILIGVFVRTPVWL